MCFNKSARNADGTLDWSAQPAFVQRLFKGIEERRNASAPTPAAAPTPASFQWQLSRKKKKDESGVQL